MTVLRWFEDFPPGLERRYGRFALSAEAIASYAAMFGPADAAGAGVAGPAEPPPLMLCSILMRLNCDGWLGDAAGRGAPGIDEIHWRTPAQVGEILSARFRVLDSRPSGSRPDIGFVRFRYDLLANDDRVVLTQTNSVMIARRDGGDAPAAGATRAAVGPAPVSRDTELPARWADAALGTPYALGVVTFDPDGIVGFAQHYDPQPFHLDHAAAQAGPFGALAASGWHTASAWAQAFAARCAAQGLVVPRLLSATDLRWRRPVYAGDTLAFETTITAVSPVGESLTMRAHGTGTNQDGVTAFAFEADMVVPAGHAA
ncbi:MaoC/PaaZ C-terminal domain-containing protein [Rhodoplanes roseus]|uniref:MaoC-like domain-containing protein n=1 Tax=Rhodoplanes roseus TaxID=29409 RepID=A0A327L100_9BRAD|nr:MaoC/PaaZ C-terminal domain-containing protein [Rhodoplanes roseus]RAI44146.1 hypothetical protein CH341_10690 [Rhodoplanes roseus]